MKPWYVAALAFSPICPPLALVVLLDAILSIKTPEINHTPTPLPQGWDARVAAIPWDAR